MFGDVPAYKISLGIGRCRLFKIKHFCKKAGLVPVCADYKAAKKGGCWKVEGFPTSWIARADKIKSKKKDPDPFTGLCYYSIKRGDWVQYNTGAKSSKKGKSEWTNKGKDIVPEKGPATSADEMDMKGWDTLCVLPKGQTTTTTTPWTPGKKSPIGICSAYGDPHIVTWDGHGHHYNNVAGTLVLAKTPYVHIQCKTRDDGPIHLIAIKFLATGRKIIIDGKKMSIDLGNSKQVKIAPDVKYEDEDLMYHNDKEDETNKEIDEARKELKFSGKGKEFNHEIQEQMEAGDIYSMKLKKFDTTIVFKEGKRMWDDLSLAMVIKMPKQQGVSGWCGTFDGYTGDDDMRWMNNNKGVVKGPGFPKEEDLFADAPKSSLIDGTPEVDNEPVTESLVSTGFYGSDGEEIGVEGDHEVEDDDEEEEGEDDEEKDGDDDHETPDDLEHEDVDTPDCHPKLRKKAESICKDIPEKGVRDSCIFDICTTKNLASFHDAYGFEVLEVLEAKGIPVFDGEGWCLDAKGKKYKSFKTVGAVSDEACEEALRKISAKVHGVHGAQKKRGESCEIITDKDVDPTKGPGRIVKFAQDGMSDGEGGHGIVGQSSGTEGWGCWKVN
eukprot:gnl/MRDRNA2_/MRDRNA2_88769_c0_seq1.p1 gnl/MRDRNA2_/MRDRNA2_88769_c0~~gnl/MRDRNA2_/MRDRNA2_88769_c0_seq1.p1  ORF type:complete len:624 (-),score=173.16 gnl/MRDRNA2_/MRDRNA2_88769_c0_seq1:70-1893(-)